MIWKSNICYIFFGYNASEVYLVPTTCHITAYVTKVINQAVICRYLPFSGSALGSSLPLADAVFANNKNIHQNLFIFITTNHEKLPLAE